MNGNFLEKVSLTETVYCSNSEDVFPRPTVAEVYNSVKSDTSRISSCIISLGMVSVVAMVTW